MTQNNNNRYIIVSIAMILSQNILNRLNNELYLLLIIRLIWKK